MAAKAKVSTNLTLVKECKSCARFGTKNSPEKVTTSLYLQNESWEKLGKPNEIQVDVSPK